MLLSEESWIVFIPAHTLTTSYGFTIEANTYENTL